MPLCQTQHFGTTAYQEDSVLEFPTGIPGFERENRFIVVELPNHKPLVFLQSLATPELCFLSLPVLAVDPGYCLEVADSDLALLELSHQPRIGTEVLCLALLTIRETGTTANLLAPVVINLKTRRAVQAIAPECRYSHQHPLG